MKKFLLATLCILIGVLALAQAPQKMSYQAVIRDNSGNLVANRQISMRISILKESVIGSVEQPTAGRTRAGGNGTTVLDQTINVEIYIETHSVTTNANGLASIEIGAGNPTNVAYNFSSIDWSAGTYFIKTDVDLNGGTRFKNIGISQLISVPYAMYAQKAGSAVNETDPQFNAWDKDYNDLTNRPEIPVVPTNVSAFENDANYITSADVPAQVNADWNATSGSGQILNKPELFSGNYNDLTNRPEIPTVPTNVSAFANDANYITSADVPAQVNADWNATSGAGQILNKPEIPTVPTNISAFANDANYITSADVPAQVNADWNATSGAGQILNKPEIPTVPTNVSAFTNDANYITSADVPTQVNADWNATSGAGQILNKPELFSGNYNDLTNRPEIPTVPTNVSAFANDANYITSADVPAQVNADWNATSGAGQILNKPEIPTVPTNISAFANDANYITSADVPAQVNADWNATSGAGQILNKPEIPTVPTNVSAFNNDANYITSADVPAQVNADWNATSGAGQILNKPELFSGNYNDLTNRPEIPTVPTNVSAFTNDANYITSADVPAQVNADWNATSGAGQILNKPDIPTVPANVSAFTNDANYITSADVPAQVNADWNATSGAGQILNKPELFSGNYNDLTNRPEIPTVPTNVSAFANDANYITSADVPAQVNADWNATSGAGQILNKPAIPTVPTNVSAFTNDANYITSADVPAQVNADWNATSGAGQILNKPEIPTVPSNVSAFTNDANYITSADVPAQVNADWNATSGAGQILNKPELFSGNYNDLTNKPELFDGNYNNLTNTPDLSSYITDETQTLTDVVALSNSAGNRQIKNVADPTENQDAVTKKYLEDIIAELRAEMAEMQATINALSAAQGGNSVTYTVTYDANGGTGTMQPQAFTAGTAQAITTNTFTKENYTFAGWNTAADGSGSAYTDGQSLTASGNMTLYAQWNLVVTYTIIFNSNGGSGDMNPQTFTAGEAQTLTTNTFTKENNNFTGWNTAADGSGTAYTDGESITATENMTLYAQWQAITSGSYSGYEWVDLGLPSGTLWATCNVGASAPEAYGNYYSWGEIATKSTHNWITYKHCNGSYQTLTKYCDNSEYGNNGYTDNLSVLETSDDAASTNWGGYWRIPTNDETAELKNNCTITWTVRNGINGNIFTGPNGNSIFLPAAGYQSQSNITDNGSRGEYWSSSLHAGFPDNASGIYFTSTGCSLSSSNRNYGRSVRPVCTVQNSSIASYTITFDANGGVGSMNSQSFTAETAQALATNTFIKENYTFAGWNTEADGSGTAYSDGQSITVSESMTLYAQWVMAYTVTFDANGGTGTMQPQTFITGVEQPINTNAFTKDFYTFKGWNTTANGSGISYTDGQTLTLNNNITLYAQWEVATSGTFTDSRDGIIYKYVKIGSQTWMAENLRYTGNISIGYSSSSSTKYRYYPNNNSSNVITYGYLYNWKAAMNGASGSDANPSGIRGICPNGWHLPSDAEWDQLINYLSVHDEYQCGGTSDYIAKSLASTSGWISRSNTCVVGKNPSNNNSSGFNALPAGSCNGSASKFGDYAYFWSASGSNTGYAFPRYLQSNSAYIFRDSSGWYEGFSVRCVRDN